jgi:hypothetical protein
MAKQKTANKNIEDNKLYSKKELLKHIESMSDKVLYIFAFLWGGLIYAIITNSNKPYVETLINNTKIINNIISTTSPETSSFTQLIILVTFSAMIIVLIMLLATMTNRPLNLTKKEDSFLSQKDDLFKGALIVGCIITIILLMFIFLIFTSPPKIIALIFVVIIIIITQVVVFAVFIYLPFIEVKNNVKTFLKNKYPQVDKLWKVARTEDKILLKKPCCYKFDIGIRKISHIMGLIIYFIGILCIKSYMLIMGVCIYWIYLSVMILKIALLNSTFLLPFVLILIVFMILYFINGYTYKILEIK